MHNKIEAAIIKLIFLSIVFLNLEASTIAGGKHDFIVLYSKVNISVRHQLLVKQTDLLLQINSKEGEKAADFKLLYSPMLKIRKLNAWIQDTTGVIIRKLEKKQIKDRSVYSYGSFYSDYMLRCFSLRHNHFPYQVHVEYTCEATEFFDVADWSPIDYQEAPTLSATLTVQIPDHYPVQILQHGVPEPVTDTVDGNIRYKWVSEYTHLIKKETCRLPLDHLRSFVWIVPREFTYGIKGNFNTWTTFGDYIDSLNYNLGVLPASEIGRIKSLTQGMSDTLGMISKIYRYLQENTRYLSVSIDIGGIKPYPASYVAQNKYGDCKALANYMKSLLEVVGITSFYTLVHGGSFPNYIDPGFPSDQFNHVILCLPYRYDTLWLDCTDKELLPGYTSSFIQGRPALVVNRGKSKLVNIPYLKTKDVAVTHTYHYDSPVNESIQVSVHSVYHGPEFEKIAFYGSYADNEQQRTLALDLLPFSNYDLVNFKFNRKSIDELSIAFDARLTIKDELKLLDDRIIFTPPAADIPQFEKISDREYPVLFPYPSWDIDTIIVSIPAGMTVKSLPATELSCEMGSYKASSSVDRNNLLYIRDTRIYQGKFGPDQYPELFTWTGAICAFERQNNIIFTPIHE